MNDRRSLALAVILLFTSLSPVFAADAYDDQLKIAVSTGSTPFLRKRLLEDLVQVSTTARTHQTHYGSLPECCSLGWTKGSLVVPVASLHLAFEYDQEGNLDKAEPLYESVAKTGREAVVPGRDSRRETPYDLIASLVLMQLYSDSGRDKEVLALATSLAQNKDQPVLRLHFDHSGAHVTQEDSLQAVALLARGSARVKLGVPANALRDFEKVILSHGSKKFELMTGGGGGGTYAPMAFEKIYSISKRKGSEALVEKSLLSLAPKLKERPYELLQCYQTIAQFYADRGDQTNFKKFDNLKNELRTADNPGVEEEDGE